MTRPITTAFSAANTIASAGRPILWNIRGLEDAAHWWVLDDYQHTNMAIVPQGQAYALLLFYLCNPTACPIVAAGDAGDPPVPLPEPALDIGSMLLRYLVRRHGHLVAEPTDIEVYWQEDSVLILLGWSHTFDAPLRRAGIEVSSAAQPVYTTTVPNKPAGALGGL